MTDRTSKVALVVAAAVGLPLVAYFAYARPGYFTSPTYLGMVVLIECLIVAICLYRRVFFVLLVLSFLFAGAILPLGGMWNSVRWVFLGTGALVGAVIMLKEQGHHFGLFHIMATFAVLAALVSAAVSRYPTFALMKAFSLFLLFVYAGTGVRLAAKGRESRFFTGLLLACEVFVAAIGIFYFFGSEVMGNPNSLGAVMGVVGAPILLWGTLLDDNDFVLRRRQILFAIAVYLAFHSQARAGLAAAFVSCGLLCVALRRYKLMGQAIIIILILLAHPPFSIQRHFRVPSPV